jgi:hypothetical protein
MLSKEDAALLTLMGLAQNYKVRWCYPSQEKIRALCLKIHGVSMSNRSLNRYLRSLEESKTIERIRRLSKRHFNNGEFIPTVNPTGAMRPSPRNPEDGRFKTTIYKFTGKAFNRMFLMGRKLNNLFKFYKIPEWLRRKNQSEKDGAAKKDNRLPKMADYNPLQGGSVTTSSPEWWIEYLEEVKRDKVEAAQSIL